MRFQSLDGYAFIQNDTFDPIQIINESTFKNYAKIIDTLKSIQNLYRAYSNVKLQFSLLNSLAYQYNHGKLNPSTAFKLSIVSATAYILMHRMLVDNCKSFNRHYPEASLYPLIQDLQNQSTEKNMKTLRDYSMHTSLPISNMQITSRVNYVKRTHETRISLIINKHKMDLKYLSKEDKKVINSWKNDQLSVSTEIQYAWKNLNIFIRNVFLKYMEAYLSNELVRQIRFDKDLWQNLLIPQHTVGVTFQAKNSIPTQIHFMDYDALSLCIQCLLNT